MGLFTVSATVTLTDTSTVHAISVFDAGGSTPSDVLSLTVSTNGLALDDEGIEVFLWRTTTQGAGTAATPVALDPDAPATALTARTETGAPTKSSNDQHPGSIDPRATLYGVDYIDDILSVDAGEGFAVGLAQGDATDDDVTVTVTVVWEERGRAQPRGIYHVTSQQATESSHWGTQVESRAATRLEAIGWEVHPDPVGPSAYDAPFRIRFARADVGVSGTSTPDQLHYSDAASATQGNLSGTPTSIEYIEDAYISPDRPFRRLYPPGRRPRSVDNTDSGFGIYLDLTPTTDLQARGRIYWREIN